MRYSAFALAPFVAAAFAQENNGASTTSSISIPPYSNTMTNFLTQTNSEGVITGMPAPATDGQGVAATSIPPVASIPAGLAQGSVYTLAYGNVTNFTVSVGTSTTIILGEGGSAATGVSIATVTGTNVATTASGSGGNQQGTRTSASGSSATTSSSAADTHLKVASGAMFGFGALVAFVL